AAMLAILMASCVKMIRSVSNNKRALARRIIGMQTLQSVAEQVANLPAKELTVERAKQIAVPTVFAPYLPGAKLSVALEDETTPVKSKRLSVELAWNAPDGRPAAP